MTNDNLFCSFCNSPFDEKVKLITGAKDTSICTNCLEKAYELVHPTKKNLETEHSNFKENLDAFKPKKIKSFLDQYVIGQENAKIAISVAVYNHYKRLTANKNEVEIEKSNILLVGSTGSGKTLLAKTVARLLDVPFCIADATVLTEAGYVGEDVESIISRLLQVADYNVDKTERGIIFIDEIDKIARKSSNPSITRDVSGEGVQQGLLKLLEGSKVKVPPQGGRKHPDQKLIEINTKDILFICGGAFNQIEKIVSMRLKLSTVGFKQQKSNTTKNAKILSTIISEDIKTFGLIPELVGRLPVIASLEELSKKDLIRILLEPKNALIKQYEKLLAMDKVKLSFNKAVLEAIAQEAIKNNLGARGLRMIMERLLQNAMYELPESGKKQLKLDINYFKNVI